MGLLEILLNDDQDNDLLLDHGRLDFPTQDARNYGPLSISSGLRYLLANFDYMNQITGYTICGYGEVLSKSSN